MPKIITVKAIEKYKIFISFQDKTEGVYNLSHLAGKGVFKAWDIDNNFSKVSVDQESGAISWPDELDIDTITVYCAIKKIEPDTLRNFKPVYASD